MVKLVDLVEMLEMVEVVEMVEMIEMVVFITSVHLDEWVEFSLDEITFSLGLEEDQNNMTL